MEGLEGRSTGFITTEGDELKGVVAAVDVSEGKSSDDSEVVDDDDDDEEEELGGEWEKGGHIWPVSDTDESVLATST